MGIYIKGIEMPIFEHQSWDIRKGTDGKWYMVDTNAETSDGAWHEIVPVPPHGRLIDADALLERFEKEEKAADEHGRDFSFSFKSGGENCTEWWPVQQMLMDAPTIIPAEEVSGNSGELENKP